MKEKVLELMEKNNVTVAVISDETGVPRTTLYSIVNDDNNARSVNAKTLHAIAKFFGVPMDYFMED